MKGLASNPAKGPSLLDSVLAGSNREAFVHFSAIAGKGYRKLAEGDVVEMTVEKGEKGLKAAAVVVLEQAAAS